jgi:hypothetical protein
VLWVVSLHFVSFFLTSYYHFPLPSFTSFVSFINYFFFANEEDGLEIQRVAANILNKQSWATDNAWASTLGIGLITLLRKKKDFYERLQDDLGLGCLFWINDVR